MAAREFCEIRAVGENYISRINKWSKFGQVFSSDSIKHVVVRFIQCGPTLVWFSLLFLLYLLYFVAEWVGE